MVKVSKLAYNLSIPVYVTDLKKAFSDLGVTASQEDFFRARHEIFYELNREMPELLSRIAKKMSLENNQEKENQ
ncbi:MAG: hypothetical protein EBU08_19495 [Micrococcales bacterium]|nr:hypothetical protein [Micrococcales bacterium]